MNTPLTPAVAQPRTSMDELMLAMDIVDTLRHEQSLVERELASDLRDDAFVARVRQIYASQGIEVSDALIRKGVEELKQDRFAYTPPARTVAVRLAEAWVDRWRWAKRGLIAGFIAASAYAVVVIPNRWVAAREYASYAASVGEMRDSAADLLRRDQALVARIEGWPAATGVIEVSVAGTRAAIEQGRAALAAQLPMLGAITAVGPETFADAQSEANQALAPTLDQLEAVDQQLDRLEASAAAAESLFGAAARLAAVEARLAGATLGDAAAERIGEQRSQVDAALRSASVAPAIAALQELERLASQVNLEYTLRIVSREGVNSGVWRHHASAPDGKNYYLVVEAIDAAGQALALPVTNEETQQTQTVSRFAIRVPQSEYERVKADKLDNGLIDDDRVGDKRRGELDVDYRVNVAGGAITDW